MDLPLPLIVTVPPDAENDVPLTLKSPATVNELLVLTEPEIVREFKTIPLPLIVFATPLIVTVPAPPEVCVSVPTPVVERFPDTLRLVVDATVTPCPETVILLKEFDPVPERIAFVPENVIVPVPVNVPLFVQLPATECEKELPVNVVEFPRETFPLIVIAAPAVQETEVPVPSAVVKFPAIVITLAGMVFTAAPLLLLSVRFP
jgi:hypothetical protein